MLGFGEVSLMEALWSLEETFGGLEMNIKEKGKKGRTKKQKNKKKKEEKLEV